MKKILYILFILIGITLVGCSTTPNETKLQSIKVINDNITLFIGESETLEYELIPNSIKENVIFDIENDSIVEINNNTVTALDYGETIVTIISTSNSEIKTDINISVVKREFKITYVLNDGIFNDTVINSFEENTGLDTLPIPTKDGYKFLGWYLGDEQITSIDPTTNQDITIVAKWEEIYVPKVFTITFELDEGYFTEDIDTTYVENIGLDSLPTPIKDGYDFSGWYLDNELVTSIDPTLNNEITIVAKWENVENLDAANNVITLQYNI